MRTVAVIALKGGSGKTTIATHLALDDVRESINELKFYREHLLRPL